VRNSCIKFDLENEVKSDFCHVHITVSEHRLRWDFLSIRIDCSLPNCDASLFRPLLVPYVCDLQVAPKLKQFKHQSILPIKRRQFIDPVLVFHKQKFDNLFPVRFSVDVKVSAEQIKSRTTPKQCFFNEVCKLFNGSRTDFVDMALERHRQVMIIRLQVHIKHVQATATNLNSRMQHPAFSFTVDTNSEGKPMKASRQDREARQDQ
jgi:hypothetical protein